MLTMDIQKYTPEQKQEALLRLHKLAEELTPPYKLGKEYDERGKCVLCGLGKRCPGHRPEVLREARKLYEQKNPSRQPRLF